MQAETYMLML
jgi:transposase-like protein